MDYLKQTQYIAQVDTEDTVLGSIERWRAHEDGILHRAFTLTIKYKNQLLLQHRKHPVFDNIFDVTISSHPTYNENTLEATIDAVYRTLRREWNINKNDLLKAPDYKGYCYYQAQDKRSKYKEHEICHVYTCEVKELSIPDLTSAYGFSLQDEDLIKDSNNPLFPLLAPWVHVMIKNKLL